MSVKESCEVNVAGLVFNVYFRHYEGCKQTETTPAEGESIELEDVYVWSTKTREYIPADNLIDSWTDFEDAVSEQIWDYIKG